MDWYSFLSLLAVIGVWLLLVRVVFPRLGVPT
jgi:hypothetical protein